ncbi:MAG: c-type cytochrome biogenesis protein CcmI [Colwellia sp.]|nr:c-type cytochrome biogenesis protein CcmI [Colwellia sp.]MCW9082647.1 c-type cytochrome biogenesis protein CcmI [Colwellia sp.]
MEIVLILLVFIATLLWVLWQPFFKQETTQQDAALVASAQKSVREQANIELYHEHKAEIEKDFREGGIDEENYQYLLAELDSSLLQDVGTPQKATPTTRSSKPFGAVWPISLSVFIVVFSIALYLKQGTLDNLMATPVSNHNMQQSMSAEQQEQARQQQMLNYIKELQNHLDEKPDDGEAWYNLGQTYVGAGEFDQAITAFEQVIRIEGEHADLLGAIAQASYYKNNQQIDAQVQGLIDRALALDINDPSTNILLGMHNFIAQEYQQAIDYWQRVIDANKQGVNIAALQEAVVEAKARLAMPASNATTSGPELKVSVSLTDEIAQALANGEDKVVFVYALPTNGKRMPLAAVKLMASDLPTVVTLNNSQAMSPQNNLGSVEQVHIFAIVSKQGGAGIKPGDYKGETHHIAVDNPDTISLVVNDLVEELVE